MFTEFSAAVAAFKETQQLVKTISTAKTDVEIKNATIDLQNKLLTLQSECLSLGDAINLRQDEITDLKGIIARYEDFATKTAGYDITRMDSGTIVYAKHLILDGIPAVVHLCPECHARNTFSILQPQPVDRSQEFAISKCIPCGVTFRMGRHLNYATVSLSELGSRLNGI